jgi:O-antigen/teichoic acid export membrane protein
MGPAALAHYTIGTYLQPVIATVRNSISDVVLPELSARQSGSAEDRLRLWRRTTVVTAIVLFAAAVLLARFAEILVVTLFSQTYLPAVALFQLYVLTFLRDSLDFGVPLRAMNRNAPILHSTLVCFVVRIALMAILIPLWGLLGAVVAMVASRFCEGGYLGVQTARAFEIPLRQLAPWSDLLKVLGAALLSGAVLYGDFWTERLGVFGVAPAAALYGALYIFLLTCAGVPEVPLLLRKLRAAPALVLRRRPQ